MHNSLFLGISGLVGALVLFSPVIHSAQGYVLTGLVAVCGFALGWFFRP